MRPSETANAGKSALMEPCSSAAMRTYSLIFSDMDIATTQMLKVFMHK
eukprot:CAMPEP_0178442754 /NCGR_PEP_ID=MMETSP0689_2-20121128/38392_1 /TAXON_ID=160604 /ORGANISM="Amphidinium massartii, Strain CS-259" /LENGTH=47 /DNA_ID= /DNA_START= /DNA_END= /DNA_ORIENTATION=